jgi:hypothetical protein
MNPDATVIFNKVELAKAIHEEAHGDRVVPIISASNKKILAKRFSLELKS